MSEISRCATCGKLPAAPCDERHHAYPRAPRFIVRCACGAAGNMHCDTAAGAVRKWNESVSAMLAGYESNEPDRAVVRDVIHEWDMHEAHEIASFLGWPVIRVAKALTDLLNDGRVATDAPRA